MHESFGSHGRFPVDRIRSGDDGRNRGMYSGGGRRRDMHSEMRRDKRRSRFHAAVASIAAIITVAAVLLLCYQFFMPNDTLEPFFEGDGTYLVVDGELFDGGNPPKIVDNEVLLPIEAIRQYIDPYICWESSSKKVTVTTTDRVIRMKTGNLDAYVNDKPVTLNIPASEDSGTVYIPIGFLSEFYGIEISRPDTGNGNGTDNGNVIIVDHINSVRQIAVSINEDAAVRKAPSIKSPIIRTFSPPADGWDSGGGSDRSDRSDKADRSADGYHEQGKDELRIFAEYDKWYNVRTDLGEIGYILKKDVVVRYFYVKTAYSVEPVNPWKPQDGVINLSWEMMYGKRPDLKTIDKMPGLDVISPTWFEIADASGNLKNRADAEYVKWAHANGYKVWALFANNFDNPEATGAFLGNTDARDNAIRQILAFASLYKLDGINIDFENINISDKQTLVQFVREISPFMREQGLVVSMDVAVPSLSENWSMCYDRKALAEAVDYLMLMAYDQHWSASPVAGSVSQLGWTESGLKSVLKEVPAAKLILGMPFYSRLWKEETDSSGKKTVTSQKALSMEGAKALIEENGVSAVWDEESGQHYAEYSKDGALYRIWIEDENSINLRCSLVHKYKLAGASSWKRGDASAEVWQVLDRNLKQVANYYEWQQLNQQSKYVFKSE